MVAVVVVLVSGCGGGSEAESKELAPADPTTVDVTVTLKDFGQPDGLFKDGEYCLSISMAEMMRLTLDNPNVDVDDGLDLYPKTTVTLADADGTTVGVQEMHLQGGTFDKGTGCTWPIDFYGVDASDFYKVTFTHGDFTTSKQFPGGPTVQGGSTVEADFAF